MFGNRHNDNNYNNHGYPRSGNSYYDEYDQEDKDWFDDDSGFHLWMFGGIFAIMIVLVLIGLIQAGNYTFLNNIGNNTDFNRYLMTYLIMFAVIFFSKKGWEEKKPYFGLRKTIITASFLMIGYGALTGWFEAREIYNALVLAGTNNEYDTDLIYHTNIYFWDILKFCLILYLVTVTSWRVIESSFRNTVLNGTLEIIKHLSQVVFFGIAFVYLGQELGTTWWTGSGWEVLFYIVVTFTAAGIVLYEMKKVYNAWNENNEAIAKLSIHNYQEKVVELADQTMRERREQFNAPEHHKNYGTDFNTVIELKDITEEESMLFEMDGSKENVLLRIPEGLKVLISINKVPEVEVQDIEKTKVVRNIVQGDANGNQS